MNVTEKQFAEIFDRWFADVRMEAIRLFTEGVAHDHCTKIAITIVDGRDVARARQLQALAVPGPRIVRS